MDDNVVLVEDLVLSLKLDAKISNTSQPSVTFP